MEVLNMGKNKFFRILLAGAITVAFVFLAGCSVNVKEEPNGQDKQVDINTLVGAIHVTTQADGTAVGLDIYPGAHLKEKDSDGSDKSANVNISGFGLGIKVVALEYQSDDAPVKVLSFYKDQLKKYGNVLECHTSGHFNFNSDVKIGSHGSKDASNELTCKGDRGTNVELKAGRRNIKDKVAVHVV